MRRTCLALACILVAPALLACPGDDEDDTGASTAGSSSDGGTTSSPATTGEPEATTGAGGTTSTAGSSGTPEDGTTAGGPDPVDACLAACEHLVKCDVQDVPNCGIPCAGVEGMIAGCEAEYLAQQACAVALSCEDLQAWADGMMSGVGYPCAAEDGAYQDCLGGGSGTG